MENVLTTKEYVITPDGIEVVERPSTDIANDELLEEGKLVEAIVNKWNEIVSATENKTIQFSMIVHNLLKDFPNEKKNSIMQQVVKHENLRTTISKDRIYQGLRLIERRPDLVEYTPEEKLSDEDAGPYLKDDGSVFFEFYFELEKYKLGNDSKVRLEKEGKENNWSVRELRRQIYKERDLITGDAKNERKRELIRLVTGKIRSLNVPQLESLTYIIDEIKNDKGTNRRTDEASE